MMAMWPRNTWPILASSICFDIFVNSYGLRRYQVINKRCADISGRCFNWMGLVFQNLRYKLTLVLCPIWLRWVIKQCFVKWSSILSLYIQFLMTALVQRLPKASPSYRRMAALALHDLTIHSRQPPAIAEWVINKLLGQSVKVNVAHVELF